MSALEAYCKFRVFLAYLILAGIIIAALAGCVKTTRVMMDKDGNKTEEVTSWEPIVVNTYPTPIAYAPPVVYDYAPPVVYRTYYSSPIVYRRSYVVSRPVYYGGRTVYIGGGHHLYRRH